MNYKWKDEFISLSSDMIMNKNLLKEICKKEKIEKLYKFRGGIEIKEGNRTVNWDLENLKEDKLRMTTPTNFNDPFDCIMSMIDEETLKDDYLKDYKELYCFLSKNFISDKLQYIHNEYITKYMTFIKSMQICCFSSDRDSILMWSHYANQHQGFCIEYNIEEMINRTVPIRPVKYCNHMPTLKFSDLNFNDALLSKYSDWKYEKEWRVIFPKEETNQYIKRLFPSAVYIGCKASEKLISNLLLICNSKKIPCYKGEQDYFSYKLNYKQINNL